MNATPVSVEGSFAKIEFKLRRQFVVRWLGLFPAVG